MHDLPHYDLYPYNTFGLHAHCDRFLAIESVSEAQTVLPTIVGEALLIIGRGSNLLLTGDYHGTVVHSQIHGIALDRRGEEVYVRCGSGESWDEVVAYSLSHEAYGAENLSGIPGDVGAAAVQNIGAYGCEIADILYTVEAVDILTGQLVTIYRDAIAYGYRTSKFKTAWKNRYFLTSVTLRLSRVFTPNLRYAALAREIAQSEMPLTAELLRSTITALRASKLPDPAVLGNAGSFFVNPIVRRAEAERLLHDYPQMPVYPVDDTHAKLSAGWLIEQCGWKGRRIGPAGVYPRQALVIVNYGGATGDDIVNLCRAVQQAVAERFGICLTTEVNII